MFVLLFSVSLIVLCQDIKHYFNIINSVYFLALKFINH